MAIFWNTLLNDKKWKEKESKSDKGRDRGERKIKKEK